MATHFTVQIHKPFLLITYVLRHGEDGNATAFTSSLSIPLPVEQNKDQTTTLTHEGVRTVAVNSRSPSQQPLALKAIPSAQRRFVECIARQIEDFITEQFTWSDAIHTYCIQRVERFGGLVIEDRTAGITNRQLDAII